MPHDPAAGKNGQKEKKKRLAGNASPPEPSPKAAKRDDIGRPANRLEIARAADTILVRVIGLGSVNNAGAFSDFAAQALEDGWRRIALDLSECRGLDSTFLGTVVGISQEIAEAPAGGKEGWVCVVNASAANRELFEIVGADRYVRFKASVQMKPIETEPLAAGLMSTEKRLELVRRAHENLVSIDARNESRFGEFLKCLAAELAKGGDEPARSP